jgi:carnitine O-acetyltransferase
VSLHLASTDIKLRHPYTFQLGEGVLILYRFNAARIPTSPADIPLAYPSSLNHIIVIRNDRYYKVDTAGRSASDLASAFRTVKSLADAAGPGTGLGVLTADDRDVWTETRRHVMSLSPANAQGIQDIESAILCVSLDDAKPQSDDERAWMYWSGGKSEAKRGHGWNRWFDKHDIIVDEAGESGFNGEREFYKVSLVRAR